MGSWVVLKDQCLFTGVNPLTGENVEEWGDRFPDASQLYSSELRVLAENAFHSAGVPFKQGYAIHTDSARTLYGPAMAQILNLFEADVVTATGVHAAMVATHRKADNPANRVLFLGEVTRHLETRAMEGEPDVTVALQVLMQVRDS